MLTHKQLSIHSGTSTKPPVSTIYLKDLFLINQQEMKGKNV